MVGHAHAAARLTQLPGAPQAGAFGFGIGDAAQSVPAARLGRVVA